MPDWPHGSEGAATPNVDPALSTLVAWIIAVAGILSVTIAGCASEPGAGGSGGLAISARWEHRTAAQSDEADPCAFDSETDIPPDVQTVRVVVQSDPTDPTQPTTCCRVDVEDPHVNRQVAIRQILQGMVAFQVDAFTTKCQVALAPNELCGSAESVESCATAGAAPTPATPAPTMCPAEVRPRYSSGTVNEVIAAGEIKRVGVCMVDLGTPPAVTPTSTATGTATITAMHTLTPTNIQTPTVSETPTATATETRNPTDSPTRSSTPTPIVTSSDTPSATATATRTDSATATDTPATGTVTATATDTAGTATATATATDTLGTGTTTATPTDTPSTVTATATVTLTPAETPTATHTATATLSPALSGHIRYYASDVPVPDVTLTLMGGTSSAAVTDLVGDFGFATVSPGMQTLQPSKDGDFEIAITALDANYVLRFVAGPMGLTPDQRLAADVTGDGTISALDGTRILQFPSGVVKRFNVSILCGSDWVFRPTPSLIPNQTVVPPLIANFTCTPGAIVYGDAFTPPASGQDFVAILFGDVTGNWPAPELESTPTPTAAGPGQ